MTLRLVDIDAALLHALRDSTAALQSHLGAAIGPASDVVGPIVEQTAGMLADYPRDPQWGCFLTVDDEVGFVVGTCGFKRGPADDGSVELAYFTFPSYEGRGYASAMAAALVVRAGDRPLIAYTLPERNASCRVLEKTGFACQGEVVDPEDGLVWRWSKRR